MDKRIRYKDARPASPISLALSLYICIMTNSLSISLCIFTWQHLCSHGQAIWRGGLECRWSCTISDCSMMLRVIITVIFKRWTWWMPFLKNVVPNLTTDNLVLLVLSLTAATSKDSRFEIAHVGPHQSLTFYLILSCSLLRVTGGEHSFRPLRNSHIVQLEYNRMGMPRGGPFGCSIELVLGVISRF